LVALDFAPRALRPRVPLLAAAFFLAGARLVEAAFRGFAAPALLARRRAGLEAGGALGVASSASPAGSASISCFASAPPDGEPGRAFSGVSSASCGGDIGVSVIM
jgi:hypothetical protein